MFAVPGWSVTADSLRTQKKPPENSNDAEQRTTSKTEDTDDPPAPLHKKRKRTSKKPNGVNVTLDNLAELWGKYIEGDDLEKVEGEDKREKKKLKKGGVADLETLLAEEKNDGKEKIERPKKPKEMKKKALRSNQGANGENVDSASNLPTTSPISQVSDSKRTTSRPTNTFSAKETSLQPPVPTTLTPLQSSMRQKLVSSRFRYLNQALYTTPSASSFDLFKQNPGFFAEYHEGFRRQVSVWPENPVDGFVRWILERGNVGLRSGLGGQKAQFRKQTKGKKSKGAQKEELSLPDAAIDYEALPRNPRGLCTIADLGCGDGKLGQTLASTTPPAKAPAIKSLNLKILSYDLAASSSHVTIADIRALPLADSSVDIAIFCLALMGTNWIDFIEDAYRVLRWKGECWVGEVGSRFVGKREKRVEHSVGNKTKTAKAKAKKSKLKSATERNDDGLEDAELEEEVPNDAELAQTSTDVSPFIEVLRKRGFLLVGEPELGNKMFVRMRFVKALTPIKGKGVPVQQEVEGMWGTKKFLDKKVAKDAEMSVEDEGRVLKPCVYKTR